MRFEEDSYHLKTHDEMQLLFSDSRDASTEIGRAEEL